MDAYDQHKLRIADITREANYSLWNGLLTLNGIIVSVFSVVAVFTPTGRIVSIIIVVASMISAFLLILNFHSTRNVYRTIGQVEPQDLQAMSQTERQKQIADSGGAHKWCNRREAVTHAVLLIQAVLILFLLLTKDLTHAEDAGGQPAPRSESK